MILPLAAFPQDENAAAGFIVEERSTGTISCRPGGTRMPLSVGEQAPDFTLSSVTGEEKGTFTLSDYRGKKNVVIAFYVLDWTPT